MSKNVERPGLLDCLDPVQLGFVYESLIGNRNEGEGTADYNAAIEAVKAAIDSNCGFEYYVQRYQELSRKFANYDGIRSFEVQVAG